MNLNPITALSGQLQKLITEHGSASILRDHLALFKDQVMVLEKKAGVLESENAILKAENDELKKKIQKYEKPIYGDLLDDNEINILTFLSNQQDRLTAEEISQSLGMNIQIARFQLEELEKYHMVHGALYSGAPRDWKLGQEGRRYLIENKL